MSDRDAPDNRIAIVGRAGRFPAARNVGEFWRLLDQGRSAATRLTDEALLNQGVSRQALADPNYVRAANILPDMESFDAPFFGFSPKEAAILDPQHRHFLETCWEALEDAGHVPERFDGRIGVYAGSGMQAYMAFNLLSNPELVEEIGLFLLRHTGNDKDFLPTRASYLLNLTGPSMAIQTACSTSLVAVHVAVNALLNMECDMALAGGVTIELPHYRGYRYAPGEILSPDGLCRAFDDDSKGTIFGSGSVVLALRRMEDALADGDDIKAVILATAVNNDGSSKANYLAPSVEGQAEAAGEALALAGVPPETVTYIEAHGTGTPIGDPIELAALSQVYKGRRGSVGIGSVKTNIGHLDTAAGGASLIKVVEALRHRRIPASLNFRTPNSRFDFAASPFRVVAEAEPWQAPNGGPRRAAVNSLGVGGTNAHVIVEEAPLRDVPAPSDSWRLFPFSARDAAAIDRTAARWSAFLSEDGLPDQADIAFTLREGRRLFPARRVVAARTAEELRRALAASPSGLSRQAVAAETRPEIVFMFPGGGAQYPGAGAELLLESPVFAKAVAECFAAATGLAPSDLHQAMFTCTLDDPEARRKLSLSSYAIPALFILEYAYARMLASWGITPDRIVAHSAGEYAAAVIAGVLSVKDAMSIVILRGRVMDAAPAGAMTTVPADEAATRALIGQGLDIAALNAPEASVVSGAVEEIAALEERLRGTDREARRIQISVAAHSRLLDDQLDAFRAGFGGVRFQSPKVPMVSSLRGAWGTGDDFTSADYWVRHLRHTVRFTDALAAALDQPGRIIVEVGPGQTLSPLVRMAKLANPPRAVVPIAPKPNDPAPETGIALAAAGELWAHGLDLDWAGLPGGVAGRRVSLPTYAFDRTRHWIAPGQGRAARSETQTAAPALALTRRPAVPDWFETDTWDDQPLSGAEPDLSGDWLVFAGDDPLSSAVLSRLAGIAGARVQVVRSGSAFSTPGPAGCFTVRPEEAEDYAALLAALGDALPHRILHLWPLGTTPAAFGSAFLLCQALQIADAGSGRRLVFAATGTSPAGAGVTNPDAAALLGPVRVAPREIDGLTCALVDLADPDGSAVPALLAEAATGDGSDHVALRGGRRFAARRTSLPTGAPGVALPSRLRQGGVYLITGGTGGIGATMALWLARRAGARLALLSRSGRADPALERAIGAAGGEVAVFAADVTDPAALRAAVDAIRARWGRIDGVIHAAGTIVDAPLAGKSLADTAVVLAPKIEGARNLNALFPPGDIDLFAVFSSSSVVIAPPGQTDYVAANAWLDALAASRPDGLAIAWGTWRDIGMAERSYGAGGSAEGASHPLLGPQEPGDHGAIRFSRRLDPVKDWVLKDHVVGGVPTLPGSAYAEVLHAAALVAGAGRPAEIRDLSLAVPMTFADGAARNMTLHLTPSPDGFDVRIESVGAAGAVPEDHARARIVFVAEAQARAPEGLVPPAGLPVAPTSDRPPQTEFIRFGPRWQSTGRVTAAQGLAEGRFALPAEFRADLAAGHALHAALLDMAMTVGLHGLPAEEHAGLVYAPVSFDRIRVLRPLEAEVLARSRLVRHEARRTVTFDVSIHGADGTPCVLIDGLSLVGVEGGALHAPAAEPTMTQALLSNGIRPEESDEVFDRVFSAQVQRLLVSPVALDRVRLAMARASAPARKPGTAESRSGKTANAVEARLAAIWAEMLGVPAVSSGDDFFALGGHSLNAVRMFSRIRREFGVDLPLATVYDGPTLAAVAARIAQAAGLDLADKAPAAGGEAAASPGTAPVARSIELTEGQREIFSGILIDPEVSRGHNLCFGLRLGGSLDPAALSGALDAVVARHDALRARFDPGTLRMETDPDARVALSRLELDALPEAEWAERRRALVAEFAGPAFDMNSAPLMRALLVTLGAGRHELFVAVHHIVCDGWSIGVVVRDLAEFYAAAVQGRAPVLPPAQSIADLVEAEQKWAATPAAARHRDYWLAQFAGPIPAMDLPTDHPRPSVRTTRANRVEQPVPPALEAALRQTAARLGTTLQNFVLAAFQAYVARLISSEDVVIGLPSSGQISHGLEEVVGHGVNFLPLRAKVAPSLSFEQFIVQARAGLLSALDHQNYTYGTLMRDLNLPRDLSRLALVPVVVNLDTLGELASFPFGGATAGLEVLPSGNEHFELFLNILDVPGGVRLSWNHNADLWEPATMQRHAESFGRLLEGLAGDPSVRIGDLGRLMAETARPASGTHDDPGASGPQVVTEHFRSVAAACAGQVALDYLGKTMDYATLDARSDALAAELASLGVKRGDLVGITSERSLSLIVAVLGVLKAGAGYVPFDTSLPAERLSFMAKDTGIRVLIGRCEPVAAAGVRELPFASLPEQLRPGLAVPEPQLSGTDVCYVMYTSGTTGVPKGVMLPHQSVVRMLIDTDWLELGPQTVTLHSSAFAFDTSIIDIFAALLHGGRVVIPRNGLLAIADLAQAVASGGVNTLWLTSGLFHAIADSQPEAFASVRQVIVGGDVVSPVHVARVMEACPGVTVINGYGPTESNVTNAHAITWEDIRSGSTLPIGRAIPGTQIYILDDAGMPVPPGIMGELAIAGRGLALGYWNRPELTAEKFIPAPWNPDLRIYRSGDLAMDPGDGVLRFFGRKDTQVKVRGFRVELAEVEAAVESHPAVRQTCVVAAVPEGETDKVLIAFVVADGVPPSRRALAEHVKSRLPAFARPSHYIVVPSLPLNANGKVDRRALPKVTAAHRDAGTDLPATRIEADLARIWCDVLGLKQIGVEADFFELGGHSLLALKLFTAVQRRFEIDLPISTLFQNATIRDLAQEIDARIGQGAPLAAPAAASLPAMPKARAAAAPAPAPELVSAAARGEDWDTTTVINPGPGTGRRPLFIVGGVGGNVNNLYHLGGLVGQSRPVVGFQTRGILGHTPHPSIEATASDNIRYLRLHQPKGPYLIAGYSGGALTAFEMARQLRAAGEDVEHLFVLDTYAPGFATNFRVRPKGGLKERISHEIDILRTQSTSEVVDRLNLIARRRLIRGPVLAVFKRFNPLYYRMQGTRNAWLAAAAKYKGGQTDCPLTLFLAEPATARQRSVIEESPLLGWDKVVPPSTIAVVQVPGNHNNMILGQGAEIIARTIEDHLGG